jgi:hypothetical protein
MRGAPRLPERRGPPGQRAGGYEATVVNGMVLIREGAHSGVFPGRVLRNVAVA